MYDFSRCKLCMKTSASPTYRLRNTTVFTCSKCGFHSIDYLDLMPPEQPDEGAPLLDDRSRRFIEAHLPANSTQHRKNLELVRRNCRLPGSRCLDIGAGAGVFLDLLSNEGAAVFGIEPQKIFRDFTFERFGIALDRRTIDESYWQDRHAGSFDVVTMWDVLEHVNFPVETLRGACHVLKPGGWLFLDTPCRNSLFYKISEGSYRLSGGRNSALLESLYSPQPFRHKQMFTQRQLVQLIGEIGCKVIALHSPLLKFNNKIVLGCRKLPLELVDGTSECD